MDLEERITQFRTMAEADPDNEMAHFSLGNALLQADRPTEAGPCFEQAFTANPEMSKALQMAGQAYLAAGMNEKTIEVLTSGYEVAAKRGDLMIKKEIAGQLQMLDAPIPVIEGIVEKEVDLPEGTFVCSVTGRPGNQLTKAPFRGQLGEKIFESIAQETWQMWIEQGTKVINELRLDLSRLEHQELYDQHMIEFLGLDAWAKENMTT